jgi:trypsin
MQAGRVSNRVDGCGVGVETRQQPDGYGGRSPYDVGRPVRAWCTANSSPHTKRTFVRRLALAGAALAVVASVLSGSPALAIVGGITVSPDAAPYLVGRQTDVAGCRGAVIGDSRILTAAHCVADPADVSDPGYIVVSVPLPGGNRYDYLRPVQVVPHPLWDNNPNHGHDVALLRMADGALTGIPTPRVGTPWNPGAYAPGTNATITVTGRQPRGHRRLQPRRRHRLRRDRWPRVVDRPGRVVHRGRRFPHHQRPGGGLRRPGPQPRYVRVPDARGQTSTQASATLATVGLAVNHPILAAADPTRDNIGAGPR